jgi:thiol-disulfide isomerase/thioredoxin
LTFRADPVRAARVRSPGVRTAPVTTTTLVALAALALLAMLGMTAGCAQTMGGAEGFVSGSGTVTVLDKAQRTAAPPVAGRTLDGRHFSLADERGSTVVLNVWGSWCAPCRDEAPDLVKAARKLQNEKVQFVGINVREPGVASAQAFVRHYGVPYPSIYDTDGSQLLGFRDTLPPDAIPSTLVVDPQGRVAARVLGTVDTTTLVGLVHDVEASARG